MLPPLGLFAFLAMSSTSIFGPSAATTYPLAPTDKHIVSADYCELLTAAQGVTDILLCLEFVFVWAPVPCRCRVGVRFFDRVIDSCVFDSHLTIGRSFCVCECSFDSLIGSSILVCLTRI